MTYHFVLCAPGAERALKEEVGDAFRPSYQRPGFVTFKGEGAMPDLVLAWERSESLGKVTSLEGIAADVIRVSALSQELELPFARLPSRAPLTGEDVAEIVAVGPEEIWAGTHVHDATHSLFAGGKYPEELPPEAPSRAYNKLCAVLAWAHLEPAKGAVAIELGSAPGGASWALLERGLQVIGVDPGAMDPRVLAHPRFRAITASINVLDHAKLPARADWIIADMNVTPKLTLKSARAIAERVRPRAMVLTLKLKSWDLARKIPEWVAEVRRWGFADVRAKQLSPHRQEVAVVARR